MTTQLSRNADDTGSAVSQWFLRLFVLRDEAGAKGKSSSALP
ncbi:MAG: hypothetical protein ACOYXT_30490 [Bacteroidota bacterium]